MALQGDGQSLLRRFCYLFGSIQKLFGHLCILTGHHEFFIGEGALTFRFTLMREYEETYQTERAAVFSETIRSGLVPLWEAVGVYDCLYNSDGMQARDISRTLAFGLDSLSTETALQKQIAAVQTDDLNEAIDFLEKLLKACTRHPAARIETS